MRRACVAWIRRRLCWIVEQGLCRRVQCEHSVKDRRQHSPVHTQSTPHTFEQPVIQPLSHSHCAAPTVAQHRSQAHQQLALTPTAAAGTEAVHQAPAPLPRTHHAFSQELPHQEGAGQEGPSEPPHPSLDPVPH